MRAPPRIRPLPKSTTSRIQSSSKITCIEDVALSLLENSLDAGASKIEIVIDTKRGNCTVEDNGHGIYPSEFEADGKLCTSYCTSADVTPDDDLLHAGRHGTTGTFLAQLAALSYVDITCLNSSSRLTIHQGEVLTRVANNQNTAFHGLRVDVRGLFGNMPVRVKQRGLATDQDHDRAWHELKHGIVARALAWPRSCAFKVQQSGDGAKTLSISGGYAIAARTLTPGALLRLQGRQIKHSLYDVLPILFQSGLAEPRTKYAWIPLSARSGGIKLDGMICTKPAPTRKCQFIAFDVHPITSNTAYNILYDTVNSLVSSSDFDMTQEQSLGTSPTDRRGIDRHVMFVLRFEAVDASTSGVFAIGHGPHVANSVHVLAGLLEAAITAWLKANGYRPRVRKKRNAGQYHAPSPTITSNDDATSRASSIARASDIQSLSRIRSGRWRAGHEPSTAEANVSSAGNSDKESRSAARPQEPFQSLQITKSMPVEAHPVEGTALHNTGSSDYVSMDDAGLALAADNLTGEQDPLIDWVDPANKQQHRINARTGIITDQEPVVTHCSKAPTAIATDARSVSRLPRINTTSTERSTEPLSQWHNPVFAPPSEEAIRAVADFDTVGLSNNDDMCCPPAIPVHGPQGQAIGTKVSKAALKRAEVIGQVDRKLVLCKVTTAFDSDTRALVLIDQHAASERIILENLLSELCEHNPSQTTILTPPVIFEISRAESELFATYTGHFQAWHVIYDLVQDMHRSDRRTTSRPSDRIRVKGLPSVIAERCRNFPTLCIEMLRSEVWALHDGERKVANESTPPNDDRDLGAEVTHHPPWLQRITYCPRGILEMLNSRACRSAIMFNDELSRTECQELVEKLGRCVFPFICAHGRVSLVPIAGAEAFQ